MLVVSNSSPLIALAHVGQLDLIRALLGEVIVPPAVVREVLSDRELPSWVRVRAPAQPFAESVSPALGPGERDAISLALETHAARIILDDLPARRFAASLGLSVVGSHKNYECEEVLRAAYENCTAYVGDEGLSSDT